MLLGGFDQFHDLEIQKKKQSLTLIVVYFFHALLSCKLKEITDAGCHLLYLSLLEWRHSTAEHSAAVAANFQEDLFVVP